MKHIISGFLLLLAINACSQGSVFTRYSGDEILIDARNIRGDIGWTWLDIKNLDDTFSLRTVQGVELKNEFKMISMAMDEYNSFCIYDALYFGIMMGKITSKTIGQDLPKDDFSREGSFAVKTLFGYDFYAGYRNKNWGVLGGIRPYWYYSSAGNYTQTPSKGGGDLVRFACPLSVRAEWRPFSHFEYRVIGVVWNTFFGPTNQFGARLEIPTFPSKRFWLFADYQMSKTTWDYLATDIGPQSKMKAFTVGFRVGSVF